MMKSDKNSKLKQKISPSKQVNQIFDQNKKTQKLSKISQEHYQQPSNDLK